MIAWMPVLAQQPAPVLDVLNQAAASAGGDETAAAVRLIVALTVLSILPGLLMIMTPFTRFVIVLSLLRQALGLQQAPPNQVLVAMALALTALSMHSTLDQVRAESVEPYLAGQIDTEQALEAGIVPMRAFMLRNVERSDLATALKLARIEHRPKNVDEVPTSVVITGFVLSELREAFTIAVKVYVPFLVVDLVVASVLLGMGMMMLPPVIISLPFKLAVFVLMDGWALLVTGLVQSVQ